MHPFWRKNILSFSLLYCSGKIFNHTKPKAVVVASLVLIPFATGQTPTTQKINSK
jgi:hypothetical protein